MATVSWIKDADEAVARAKVEHKPILHSVCESRSGATAAPEACYWEGVAAYKADNQANHLHETYRKLSQRYTESEWAKKASVWAG